MNSDDTRTSSTLLRRTADWQDHVAWQEFVARYEPYIRSWCREYRLDDDLAEDVCQLFWVELAEKMRSFRYDPSRRFRGWLRRCFHWRVVDAIRERSREEMVVQSLDDVSCLDVEDSLLASEQLDEEDDEPAPRRLLLLDLAEQVQAAVREKVHAQSWQVFWHISIDGWSTRQAADALNMSYVAAHAAHRRVVDRLAHGGRPPSRRTDEFEHRHKAISTMTNCPSVATLRLIGTEAVGEATIAGLEGHVEQCPDCQRILEAATQADPPGAAPARSTPPTLPGLVIERELGRGGAGAVYLAWEPALKRHVAVKLFPRNSLVDRHAREHWLAEAQALSRVPHDHVVAIHRVDENEEWLWLVIEYVPGGALKDRLTEPLPPRDAARLTETIARAVGYFHTRGVFHLDLKPSNILLDGEPGAPWEIVSPKISDFGIARLEGEPGTTETGANGPKGTPSYMAPEQVAALPGTIGPAADLHALGALLYHLLTGRPPFQGASSAETLDQVRNQDPVPPRGSMAGFLATLKPSASPAWKKPRTAATRLPRPLPATCGSGSKVARSRPAACPGWGTPGDLCRRHPAVAGLLVTLALTLATGVVGLIVLLNQVEAEHARLAEARRNAEAYEKFSASAADQLLSFLRTTIRLPAEHHARPEDSGTLEAPELHQRFEKPRNRPIVHARHPRTGNRLGADALPVKSKKLGIS